MLQNKRRVAQLRLRRVLLPWSNSCRNPQHRLLAGADPGLRMHHAEALAPLLWQATQMDGPLQVRQVAVAALGHFRAEAAGRTVLKALKRPGIEGAAGSGHRVRGTPLMH